MRFTCDVFPIRIWLDIEDDWKWNDAMTYKWDWAGANITLYRNSKTEWRETLLHEVIHAVSHWLRHIGIDHTEDTEEAYTYLIQYFYFKIERHISKKKLL